MLFLAPEVILARDEDGAARDLYALGCVGYYLLTGTDVFTGATVLEVCAAHVQLEPEPPSERLGSPVPHDIERLVLDLLAKQVSDRPTSASVVAGQLESCECFGMWSQRDARGWWREHGPALRERRRAVASGPPKACALTVNVDNRAPKPLNTIRRNA